MPTAKEIHATLDGMQLLVNELEARLSVLNDVESNNLDEISVAIEDIRYLINKVYEEF